MDNHVLVTLPRIAATMGVPALWLRREALAGRIPCLKIGRSIRFYPPAVERALAERTAESGEKAEVAHA